MNNGLRLVVAENLERELRGEYPSIPDETGRCIAFEKYKGIAKETTRRILKAQNAANLDTLEAIADALSIPAYRLLIPTKRAPL